MEIYLDNAATTRPCEPAVTACFSAMAEHYGNPSSLHGIGVDAENIVTSARKAVASGLSCEPECLTFTSGATEANNTVIFGAAERFGRRANNIVVTDIEHPSVSAPIKHLEEKGFSVTRIKPRRNGDIDEDEFISAVTKDTFLACCMLVNNETGAVLPVRKIFSSIKRSFPGCVTHCDAVQGFMKLPIKAADLSADHITVSAHKIHGLKGVGALYSRKGTHIPPLMYGGGQERGMRSGTESVPLIAAFGAAVNAVMPTMNSAYENAEKLSGYLINELAKLNFTTLISCAERNSPFIVNFAVEGIRSEIMLHFLESRNIYVSGGSACSKGAHSHVLESMGIDPLIADSALRISLSRTTQKSELDALLEAVEAGHSKLAKR